MTEILGRLLASLRSCGAAGRMRKATASPTLSQALLKHFAVCVASVLVPLPDFRLATNQERPFVSRRAPAPCRKACLSQWPVRRQQRTSAIEWKFHSAAAESREEQPPPRAPTPPQEQRPLRHRWHSAASSQSTTASARYAAPHPMLGGCQVPAFVRPPVQVTGWRDSHRRSA